MPKPTKERDCATLSCPNKSGNRNYCSTCRNRKYNANNPIGKAYRNLKSHAKARGIKFSLTLQGFIDGIAGTGYMELKGRRKHDLTIDRIIEEINEYYDGGIQVLPNYLNVRKRRKTEKAWQSGTGDCPF